MNDIRKQMLWARSETLSQVDRLTDLMSAVDALVKERDAWRNAAELAWHLPTHNTDFGPLNCWQCAAVLEALETAQELSTHPLDNIDFGIAIEVANDAQ